MAIYTFGVPSFYINQIRSAHSDTLSASAALKVMNANGGLHQDWGSRAVTLGDHHAGDNVFLEMIWQDVDVPDPTPENPDGGAVYWTFLLVNKGDATSGWLDVLNKAADAFAGALADKVVTAASLAGGLGSLAALAGILGLQELINLFTANCDGVVASSQGFAFTARQLAELVANPNLAWSTTQDNPGTDSSVGCGANSDYHVNYLIQAPVPRRTFQALDSTNVFVLGTDGKLWLEQPPFGKVPPKRQQVDGNVRAFQTMALIDFVWVLGTDGKLWLEQGPFGHVPPQRQQIDGNVQEFQPLDLQHVLVLGRDGKLWLEQAPFGTVPPQRQQIDGNVAAP